MRRPALGVAVVMSALLLSGCVGQPPTPTPTSTSSSTELQPAAPLPLDQLAAFSGVAAMNAGSNCTGTLVDTGVPAGPAYVLTNGHCTGDVGRPAQATTIAEDWFGTAEFLRAEGALDATLTVPVTELAYSTMRQTDTAIVRLEGTLGDLEAKGIVPVPVSAAEPSTGDHVVNVGVPVHNLVEKDWVLRRGSCTLGAQHTLIEFLWLWYGVWSNDCPGIIQGSSGSPLLRTDASGAPTAIVGMINTTSGGVTRADGGACFINRPCQVRDPAPEMIEQTSYAQSVAGLGACFDRTTGVFALGGACPLPTSSVWAQSGGGIFRGGGLADATGRTPTVELIGRTGGDVRTALVPIGDGRACLKPATYAGAASRPLPEDTGEWDAAGLAIDVDLPTQEGWYLYCAVSDADYAGAASVLFQVDRTPPIFPAAADVERLDGNAAVVRPHLNPPEIATVRFTWGRQGDVDCTDTKAFQDFFIVPLTLESSDLPATYCVYGLDAAGNATPVTKIDIPRE